MLSSHDELHFLSNWVSDIELQSLRYFISVLNEGNSSLCSDAVWIIEVCPHSFNVSKVDVLNNVPLVIGCVTSCEMIEIFSLPNSQHSVTHSTVIDWNIHCKSCDKVPGSVLSSQKSDWIGCQESCPESVSIFFYSVQWILVEIFINWAFAVEGWIYSIFNFKITFLLFSLCNSNSWL